MSAELTTLGKYAKVQGGYAYKSKDFSGSGTFPVLKIKNVRFGHVDYSETTFINENLAKETIGWATNEGDILISMTGSGPNAPQSLVGRVARVWKGEPKALINQRVGRIKIKNEGSISPDFLFYLLSSPPSQDYLVSNSSGSANQANISSKTIESLPCPKVTYEQSVTVAKVLKNFDEKILLNRQINQTMEQIAQAIFKSWFVDFEPVKAKIAAKENGQDPERAAMCAISGKSDAELNHLPADQLSQLATTTALFPDELVKSDLGMIPKGWMVLPFSEVARLDTTSVKPQNEPEKLWEHYSIPAFDASESPAYDLGSEIKSNKYKVNVSAILASKLNPHFQRTWWPATKNDGVAICSTEFMQFVPHDSAHRAYVHGLIVSKPFQDGILQRVTGTTGSRQRAQPKAVAEMNVVTPTEDLVATFCSACECMLKQKATTIKENENLTQLRDTLLPKLLSGEITVAETQAQIEAAV